MFAGCMLSGKVDQGGNLACAGDAVRVWQLETTADQQSKEAPSHTLMPEADESKDGMPNAEVWRVRWNVTGTVLASSGATVRIRATHRGPTSPLWHIIWGWADRRRWQSTSLEAFICYGRVCASTRRLGMKWNPWAGAEQAACYCCRRYCCACMYRTVGTANVNGDLSRNTQHHTSTRRASRRSLLDLRVPLLSLLLFGLTPLTSSSLFLCLFHGGGHLLSCLGQCFFISDTTVRQQSAIPCNRGAEHRTLPLLSTLHASYTSGIRRRTCSAPRALALQLLARSRQRTGAVLLWWSCTACRESSCTKPSLRRHHYNH
jgi:hypothetical protein